MSLRAAAVVALARPFTLLAPALGFASAAVTAMGAAPHRPPDAAALAYPVLGTLMAATLNAASNSLNQIFDREIDRVNKPHRPLPAGALSSREAWAVTASAYAAALALAWMVAPEGRRECFWIVVMAALCTLVYSIPPLRTKRFGILANVTIAVPRGILLKAAGWASVKTVAAVEPWFIGGIFGLFLLGATTTKDFADMEGDGGAGCRTLPVVYGPRRAAWMIAPSFVLPFLLIPAGVEAGILTGNPILLHVLAAALTAYGIFVCVLMLRQPADLARDSNHASWTHMYWMMLFAQVGFAAAYVIR